MDIGEDKKSFAAALAFIPRWIAFLTDDSMMYYKGYSMSYIFDIMSRMYHAGYEKEQIETVLSTFLEELERHIPGEARHLARNLPHYAEKEPWLNDYLSVFEQYTQSEEKQ